MTSSTIFVDYLEKEMVKELENLYGENFPELVDYEMRKYVERLNKRKKRIFGMTTNELNRQLSREGLLVDITETGYLYGNDITETWDWLNAEYFNDEETMKELLDNKEVELAKRKAIYIKNHINLVLPDGIRYDYLYGGLTSSLSKFANNAMRKRLVQEHSLDEKKILGFDWM